VSSKGNNNGGANAIKTAKSIEPSEESLPKLDEDQAKKLNYTTTPGKPVFTRFYTASEVHKSPENKAFSEKCRSCRRHFESSASANSATPAGGAGACLGRGAFP
jgi:hypothetical protein